MEARMTDPLQSKNAGNPKPTHNIHGQRLASCDCCGQVRVLHRADTGGLEAHGCAQCTGNTLCPKCLDDADMCECEAT